MSKLKKILKELKIINDVNENSVLLNLLKKPPKEKKDTMPITKCGVEGAVLQIDLLFLPEDPAGYKYLLNCVDLATLKVDAEPLKSKDSEVVKKALIKIFKRDILKLPERIEVDAGTEFKGDFSAHFGKLTHLVVKNAGRHRQMSVIEGRNAIIGNIVNTGMLSEEINTDETSKSWSKYFPDLIRLLNENYAKKATITKANEPEIVNKDTGRLLEEGTKVRTVLDNPTDYVSGERLHGSKFRKGDIKYDPKIKTVTQVYLRPAQVPLYQLDNDLSVAFSKPQLQQVLENEVMPPKKVGDRQYAQRITDKKKEKGLVYYEVVWEDGSKSMEPLKSIKDDLKEMIKEYEKQQKKK